MAGQDNVTPMFPRKSAKAEQDVKKTARQVAHLRVHGYAHHNVNAWFIRHHADGSWSIATDSDAVNDTDYFEDAAS